MPAVVVEQWGWWLSSGGCGAVGLWGCGAVGLWVCGSVGLWGCGAVGLWLWLEPWAIDVRLALLGMLLGITRCAAACARWSLRPVSTPLTSTTPSRSYAASCSSVSVMRRPREGRNGMAVQAPATMKKRPIGKSERVPR